MAEAPEYISSEKRSDRMTKQKSSPCTKFNTRFHFAALHSHGLSMSHLSELPCSLARVTVQETQRQRCHMLPVSRDLAYSNLRIGGDSAQLALLESSEEKYSLFEIVQSGLGPGKQEVTDFRELCGDKGE